MCNINVLIKSKKFKGDELDKLLNFYICVNSNSFINNHDGEGFYFSKQDEMIKSKNKINLLKYKKEISESNIILGHQRFTTSGYSDDYIHPFKSEDFILIHNGVISSFARDGHSDTYGFFNELNKTFKSKKGDRVNKIVNSLKEVLEEVIGYWSIFLYDRVTKKGYYFKDDGARINAYTNKKEDIVYLTTKDDNYKLLDLYFDDFDRFEIKNNKIYEIDYKDKIKFNIVGEITHKPLIYVSNNKLKETWDFDNLFIKNNEKSIKSLFQKEKEDYLNNIKFNMDIIRKDKTYCGWCQSKKTKNFSNILNQFICNSCLIEQEEYLDFSKGVYC